MANVSFLINAKRETVASLLPGWGVLVPPDLASAAVRRSLAVRRGRFVVSDNGAFNEFSAIAKDLTHSVQLQPLFRNLWLPSTDHRLMSRMLEPAPDAVIGPECLAVGAIIRSDLDDLRILPRLRTSIANSNLRVLEAARALRDSLRTVEVYPVLSMFDYASAFDAGRLIGSAPEVTRVAIGFGAFMRDARSVVQIRWGSQVVRFGLPVRRRLLSIASIGIGFRDGVTSVSSMSDRAVHCLGLGTPITVPIIAEALSQARMVSLDATSPLTDARQGVLYTSRPAFLRLQVQSVAERLLTGVRRWSCPCPFCRSYSWPQVQGRRTEGRVSRSDLYFGGEHWNSFPLFRMGSHAEAKTAESARAGHNHWILVNATKRAHDPEWRWRSVDRYCANTAPASGKAVRACFDACAHGISAFRTL